MSTAPRSLFGVRSLFGLQGNALYCVLLEPLWATTGTIIIYYYTLYLQISGLTPRQIGVVISARLAFALICQICAGAITDRLGRRRTSLVFDLLGWAVPMALWAWGGGFAVFLLAALLNALGGIVGVSFYLMATEDAPEEARPRVFAALKVIVLTAGLLTPVAGALMDRFGERSTLRWIYLVGLVCMLTHFIVRHLLVTETRAGRETMAARRPEHPLRELLSNLRVFAHGARALDRALLVGIYVATTLAVTLNVFQVVYLADVLAFGSLATSSVPAVIAATALLCYLAVRRLSRVSAQLVVVVGLGLTCLGWLVFLGLSGHGATSLVLLVASMCLVGAGTFLAETHRDALFVTVVPGAERAGFLGGVQAIAAVLALPSGVIAAALYQSDPRLLYAVILGVYALALACAIGLHVMSRRPGPAVERPDQEPVREPSVPVTDMA